jgi:hypothetical protein
MCAGYPLEPMGNNGLTPLTDEGIEIDLDIFIQVILHAVSKIH